MSVGTELRKVQYEGNDATTVFPVDFPFKASSHLKVRWSYQEVVDELQVEGVDYIVTGGNGNVGEVEFLWVPDSESIINIERTVPYLQPTALPPNGPYSPVVHERSLDNLEYQIQQLRDELDELVGTLENGPVVPTVHDLAVAEVQFTAEEPIEETFPQDFAVLDAARVLVGVKVIKAANVGTPDAPFEEVVSIPNFSQDGATLRAPYITGITPGQEYLLTLELTYEAE